MGRSFICIISFILLFVVHIDGLEITSGSGVVTVLPNKAVNVNNWNSVYQTDSLSILYAELEGLLKKSSYKEALPVAIRINDLLKTSNLPPDKIVDKQLMVGTTYLLNKKLSDAERCYKRTLELLKLHPVDSLYAKVYYNLGTICTLNGDFMSAEPYYDYSLSSALRYYRKDHPYLAVEYIGQSITSLNQRNYKKGLDLVNEGLRIVGEKPDSVPNYIAASLFQTKGTVLSNIFNYHQAILNFKKAIGYFENGLSKDSPEYINLLSNIITACYYLDQLDQCTYYFRKGENLSSQYGTSEMFNLCLNYSSILAEHNRTEEGLKILTREFNRIKKTSSNSSREYYNAMLEYAGFYLEYNLDASKAMDLYLEGYKYLRNHQWDISLRYKTALGYASALALNGNYQAALDSVRSILFNEAGLAVPDDYFINPPDSLLKPDKVSFDILSAKYRILRLLSTRSNNQEELKSAANTAELMITILEQIRLNIGEEESRLLLGNKYRDAYLNVIQSLSDCYSITQNRIFLEKAFEYSEKSKASSLLAFMREMEALEGVIPDRLADMEREAEKRIGFYTDLSEKELSYEKPDTTKLELWNEYILAALYTRDSLKNEFADNYPEYYALKYDTRVASISDVQKITGAGKNYISYVVSDTVLYIMVVNAKNVQLVSVSIDTSFTNAVQSFRDLLSSPDRKEKAANEFTSFQRDGYFLYSVLVKPVSSYLISDELILSPDNTLAFFPFETLLTKKETKDDLIYSTLSYLMRDFRISYAYSATLLSESHETKRTYRNRLVAFSPSYKRPVDIDSLWVNRQDMDGNLPELKYAPEEARFVKRITNGTLFRDSSASKRRFLSLADKFDIIHLAMHTVLNNNDPSNSGMIFSDSDTLLENNLRPYEIYAIRLNAKMVVLSSCFTGTGALFAGEGVLSIARGFIFAGSRSVVMSLWQVDDRSGTELIKSFYRNLKYGSSKSESLRKARIDYLKKSDMLHSHPYFWSTMVIYGDDSPVYISLLTRILFLMIPLLLAFFIFNYFRKR